MNEKTIERIAGYLEILAAFTVTGASKEVRVNAIDRVCVENMHRLRELVTFGAAVKEADDYKLFSKWFTADNLSTLVFDHGAFRLFDLHLLTHHEYVDACCWLDDCDAACRRKLHRIVDKWEKVGAK